ncbi:Facilitated trehalose transporter Tret1, partial [Papilio machaon]
YRSRGMATGMAAACNYVIVFLATKTNYNLEASFHISGTFAIYAILAFIGTMYLYLYLPETENKSLAEIEAYYKGNQKIFANDCLINAFRKKNHTNTDVVKPMLVN